MLMKFEQNRMVRTMQNFELFDGGGGKLTILNKVLMQFKEDVSVTETIVWCYTNNLKTIIYQCSKSY